jgi:hypothetical protein
MDNIFVLATIISVTYLLLRFIEMRFVAKEAVPLKLLIKDALFVYFSILLGYFVIEQVKPTVMSGGGFGTEEISHVAPQVFTDNPEF